MRQTLALLLLFGLLACSGGTKPAPAPTGNRPMGVVMVDPPPDGGRWDKLTFTNQDTGEKFTVCPCGTANEYATQCCEAAKPGQ